MGFHDEDRVALEDFLDIMNLEPGAMEMLGGDFISAILRAGRSLPVGTTTTSAAASCSLGGQNNNVNACSRPFSPTTNATAQSYYSDHLTNDAPGLGSETQLQPTLYNQLPVLTSPILAGANNTNIVAAPNPAATTMSAKYRGDPRLKDNYSAAISPGQSTSLFIKNLLADITVAQIFAHIRSTGKVYSLHINPPTPPHYGCAAKISFFAREAAAKFYNNTRGGFSVGGHHRAIVVWNRVLVAEHVGGRWDEASRVVIVRGPREVVSRETVTNIIHREIRLYDLAMVCETVYPALVDGFVELEMHFSSFRAQAQSAHIVLNRALRRKGVKISYGVDPCA